MASATAMDLPDPHSSDVHNNRRLAISKSSSGKISKASMKKTTAPPRPVAKVYNADPSSFRRVVQELTGTSPSPEPALQQQPPPARPSSRLQKIAPPPLRPDFIVYQQHQQQSQQDQHHHHHHHQQQQQQQQQQLGPQQMGPFAPPPFLRPNNNNPAAAAQFVHTLMPRLPMLSPHLLSPLPALTPGDNTWANLVELPPPVGLSNRQPTMNGHGNANGNGGDRYGRGGMSTPAAAAAAAIGPPPLPLAISPAARFQLPWSPRFPLSPNFMPPFSPGFLPPLSPGVFPPSPGFGLGNFYGGMGPNGSSNLGSSHEFTFQGPTDYGTSRNS